MIKKWILKAIVQKTISTLPFKNNINNWFQKYVTKGVQLTDEHFQNKITHAKDHIEFLTTYKNTTSLSCFELGTGWYPVIPISLYLSGVNEIFTIDISKHLSKQSFITTLKKFMDWNEIDKLSFYLPQKIEQRWKRLRTIYANSSQMTLDEMLDKLNIQTIVGDARKVNLPKNSIDFICSNNTFEHIYPHILEDILTEFKRLIKTNGGLMSHFIDLTDHFAHFDSSITIYNFLKFSEKRWTFIDNSIQPQNRLRFPQYIGIYEKLQIPAQKAKMRKGDLEELSTVNIETSFNIFTKEELAISHGYIVSYFE